MEKAGITYPEGFYASGLHCGIKDGGANDLALIYSKMPCTAAGTFTTNRFKSYSLRWSLKNIKNPVHAVLINSGNANTCNGEENYRHTAAVLESLSRLLETGAGNLLIASTGTIGVPLPHGKIIPALPELVGLMDEKRHADAAMGIMTTDTKVKECQVHTGIKGRKKEVVLGGMAKGAGMINPCMATMLGFISTDAVIDRKALDSALKAAVEDSFNMITVDNDTSTNDMAVCLANGSARNKKIYAGTVEYGIFARALKSLCTELAKMIAADGEGAGKLIEVRVKGAWSEKDAARVAKKVAGSSLVKASVYGSRPGWGRILSSAGSAHAKIDPGKIEVSICGIKVYNGNPVPFSEKELEELMSSSGEIIIEIDLKKGTAGKTAWGCDLTEEYVGINKE